MATVSVRGIFRIVLDLFESASADTGTPQQEHKIDYSKTITSGQGSNQGDLIWTDARVTTPGVPDDLDLRGVLATALNSGINFTKVKGIVIQVVSETPGYELTVGGDASPFFTGLFVTGTDKIRVRPGGAFAWYAPIATDVASTAAGANDVLQVDGGANAVSYKIGVIGTTV